MLVYIENSLVQGRYLEQLLISPFPLTFVKASVVQELVLCMDMWEQEEVIILM